MGEGSIKVCCLVGHLTAGIVVITVFYLPHNVYTVGNHDENDTHIFGKR